MGTESRVTFHTLGCKLNQAESELLARQFAEAGYRVSSGDNADVCVVNTCTVTHVADRKSRHLVRLLRKKNPEACVIATGCYAERAPQELAQVGADLVVDNEQKMHLLELVRDKHASALNCSMGRHTLNGVNRVRSFIKIQDGCSDFCAYCIVPKVRRRKYCLPVTEVISQVKARASAGYREVILTGTKIGAYEHDGASLRHLVQQILGDTDVERLHLSSLQPQEISPELLSLWHDPRLCRHFHLALQSGSDAVLERMRRRYSTADYRRAVALIREAVPGAAITTDVMVGFPGESCQEFEESCLFCREIGFANIHVFAYSRRPETLAAKMPEEVHDRLKKQRSLRMLELAQESVEKFRERFLGQNTVVLWEKEVAQGSGIYSGLSDNYIRVFTQSDQPLTSQLLPVRLVGLHGWGLWGEVSK